jgi:hypothetical protein
MAEIVELKMWICTLDYCGAREVVHFTNQKKTPPTVDIYIPPYVVSKAKVEFKDEKLMSVRLLANTAVPEIKDVCGTGPKLFHRLSPSEVS